MFNTQKNRAASPRLHSRRVNESGPAGSVPAQVGPRVPLRRPRPKPEPASQSGTSRVNLALRTADPVWGPRLAAEALEPVRFAGSGIRISTTLKKAPSSGTGWPHCPPPRGASRADSSPAPPLRSSQPPLSRKLMSRAHSRAARQWCRLNDLDVLSLRKDQHACELFTFELRVCFGLFCQSRGSGGRGSPLAPPGP